MRRPGRLWAALLLAFASAAALSSAEEMVLDYMYRYNCQEDYPDHLMEVKAVPGGRAIIGSNRALALVNLTDLTQYGTTAYLDRIWHINCRNVYIAKYPYIYITLNRGENVSSTGFGIAKVDGNTLQYLSTWDEGASVIWEKMAIDGDYLYVAAHSKGIRIFSIADPENPVLAGTLTTGFVDAFAIAVSGTIAYVADGAGGLKIVDVADKANPFIIDGEDLSTAVGTAQDVTVRDGNVYVAAGGAGVAIYPGGDLSQRKVRYFGGCSKDFCWLGDYLAVANMWSVAVIDVNNPLDPFTLVASEAIERRKPTDGLRTCAAVDGVWQNHLLCANWDYMDVYKLVPQSQSTKADINCLPNRLSFEPGGGGKYAVIQNNGAVPLNILGIDATAPGFSYYLPTTTLQPGEGTMILVDYNGAPNAKGALKIYCNDPDENPFPLQVFGDTEYLDPSEPAIDFTLTSFTKDPGGGFIEEPYTLSDHYGKIIWFDIFASW